MLPGVIQLARPWLGQKERDAVQAVLETGILTQGPRVAEFETRLAEICNRRYAIACSSGTSALELALAALEVTDGEVLCPDLGWPSPAHAIIRSGAIPALYDVDPICWNGSPKTTTQAMSENTRAAIVVDQFGMPATHPFELSVPVIVDAACSLGATVNGNPSPTFGTIACISFHPRKLLTTGEGGACVTDDATLAEAIRIRRDHGRCHGRFIAPAGNHRMTEIAAAIGLCQFERLDAILERRRSLATQYRRYFPPDRFQRSAHHGIESNAQTFGLLVDDRDGIIATLRNEGIEAASLSFALDRVESLTDRFRAGSESFQVAHDIEDRGVALPLHPLLTDTEQRRIIELLRPMIEP